MSHGYSIPDQILRALRLRPKGMTITDIAKQIGATRNSVSKHLEILHIGGKVDVNIIGNAKLYSLAQRIPISDFLCFTKNLILVLDSTHRITQVNDQFLDHFQINRDDLIEMHILDAGIPIISTQETLDIIEATKTERVLNEFSLVENQDEFFYTMEVIRTMFEYGGAGVTIVLDNITERKRAELAVRESEERYRNVVMHQTEFICRFLPDGTHLFVNEAYCRRFNKTEEELIGTRFKPVIHPDDREKVTRLFAQLTPDHPTGKIDQRIILQDHDIVWDRWITRAFFNDDGTVREYQSVGRDITDRKEVEETLRAQQHLLEGVLDNISDVLAIQHPDHSIERYNKAGYDLLGMTPEEVKGKKCYEIIGRDRECEPCATTRAVQSGQKEQLEKFVPELGLFLDCRSNPIVDEEGNVILIIEQLRDITRQKIAEEQLRISEGRFRNVIELLPLAAAIIDPDGNYTFINNRFTEMFGYTLEDISAGKDWFTLAYPDPSYREEVIAAWKADRSALGPGTARPRKFWVRCRNGDTKLIFFQPVELCEGSEFILYEDITEDRQVYDLLIKEIDQLRRE